MNNKNINIEDDLDSLREGDPILPGEDFKSNILSRLQESKGAKRNSFSRAGGLLILIIFLNLISFFTMFDFQTKSDKDLKLKTVIKTFSLDR